MGAFWELKFITIVKSKERPIIIELLDCSIKIHHEFESSLFHHLFFQKSVSLCNGFCHTTLNYNIIKMKIKIYIITEKKSILIKEIYLIGKVILKVIKYLNHGFVIDSFDSRRFFGGGCFVFHERNIIQTFFLGQKWRRALIG